MRVLLALGLAGVLLGAATPAVAEEQVTTVPVEVAGGSPMEAAATRCAGTAPATNHCTGSFTVTGSFNIRFGHEIGYFGYLYIRGETATYSVEIFCDRINTAPPTPCEVTYLGELYEGQTFAWYALAPAFGYWFVEVPA